MTKKMRAKINYVGRSSDGEPQTRTVSRLDMARQNSPRTKAFNTPSKKGSFFVLSKAAKTNLRKAGLVMLAAVLISITIAGIWMFSFIQALDAQLPSTNAPFGDKEAASVIYDRNGKELYRVFNEFNRDPVTIEQIPAHVKWSFLAAEDVDFYTHTGFDAVAIARCAFLNITTGTTVCGGSTVTQQAAKIALFTNEQSYERKLKELLMAMKMEQAYSKDKILELYLTVAPFGRNVYGVTTAAEVYFNKSPKDLTLSEAAILAGIIQNPVFNSPTLAPDPAEGKKRAIARQEYILGQLLEKKDKINAQNRINSNNPDAPDLITEEIIAAARSEEITYSKPRFGVKPIAGHFIDYVTDTLQQRNYKNGEEPFDIAELQNGGYKIYTTLDRDLQKIGEKMVRDGVSQVGQYFGAANGALVTLKPDSGEVLVMVGSKNYNGTSEGCNSKKRECEFDPQVNILTSRQSPGSSTKPMGYYEAYRQGIFFPGSSIPDFPISVSGYSLKNWNGQVSGANTANYASSVLKRSLNLPAIIVVELIGVESFLKVMRDFGYSTYNNSSQFGASVILGGADVLPIEHAQGYGVFSNGGDFVQHEVVRKIEDRFGNVVYQHKAKRNRVADPRAVYLLNQSLLNNYNMASSYWEGNDLADKTGTSENNRDVQVMAYSPDIVNYFWMGKNNNKPMSPNAFGANLTNLVGNYLVQIRGSKYFSKKRPFAQPAGVSRGGGCRSGCEGENVGLASEWMITDFDYHVDNIRKSVEVCTDQQSRLARDIDKQLGLSIKKQTVRWLLPRADLQKQLDAFIKKRFGVSNQIPTEPCTKDRSGGATGPWFFTGNTKATSPALNQIRFTGYIGLNASNTVSSLKAYIDFDGSTGMYIGDITTTGGNFDATIDIPNSVLNLLEPGKYSAGLIVTDSASQTAAIKLGRITVHAATTTNMVLSVLPSMPSYAWGTAIGNGTNLSLNMNYTGKGTPYGVKLAVLKNGAAYTTIDLAGPGYVASWGATVPNENATYTFALTGGVGNTGSIATARPIPGLQVVVTKTP
jgi:membrane peptidoglycan carboxypeptidase